MPESGENQCLNGIARHFPALGILPQMPNSAFATKSLARIIARDILGIVPGNVEKEGAALLALSL